MSTKEFVAKECAVFFRVAEKYGSLSNMASGYPITVAGVKFRSSEALYQACKFNKGAIQRLIINEKNPLLSKRIAQSYKADVRHDWMDIRVRVMAWVVFQKIVQNFDTFGKDLVDT